MNPDNGDGNSPSPSDPFAKIFHVIEQSEDRIHQTNKLAARIAQCGFLHRSMLLGPVIATVPRTHANGTPLPPMVYRSALYAPMGLGVSASWTADARNEKPWITQRVKGVHTFSRFEVCPYLWRYILIKRHQAHLEHLTRVLQSLIRNRFRVILGEGRTAIQKQAGLSILNKQQEYQFSVNRLLILLARLVMIRRLGNQMKGNEQGDMESGGS